LGTEANWIETIPAAKGAEDVTASGAGTETGEAEPDLALAMTCSIDKVATLGAGATLATAGDAGRAASQGDLRKLLDL